MPMESWLTVHGALALAVMLGTSSLAAATPTGIFSVERHRSNIPIHDSRSHGIVVGVSRAF